MPTDGIKTTALPVLAAADVAAGDLFYLVDVSAAGTVDPAFPGRGPAGSSVAVAAFGLIDARIAAASLYRPGSTDVSVADGGTGASTAASARTNLGLIIGTDVLSPTGSGAGLTGITQSQIASLTGDIAARAPLASPALTGTPTAPTATVGTNTTQIATCAFVLANAGSGGGSGTVTSVGLSLPSILTVSGSPVTGSGTLSATLATQVANTLWAGPTNGADSAPLFRTLVGGDIPDLSATYLTKTGNLAGLGSLATARTNLGLGTAATQASTAFATASHTHTLSQITDVGTAASLNVPASGDAATGQVVKGSDSRLTDSRTPTTHTHTTSQITDLGSWSGSTSINAVGTVATGTWQGTPVAASYLGTHTHAQSDVTNLTTDLASKAPLASPALTGTPTAPSAAVDTNTTQLATTAYVVGQGYLKSATAVSIYAPLANPALTGTPTAPTATVGTNTTQIATTAFVLANAGAGGGSPGGSGTQVQYRGGASTFGGAANVSVSSTNGNLILTSQTTPGTVADGELYQGNQRTLAMSLNGGMTHRAVMCLFTGTAAVTVANTTTETTILGSGVGTLTFPANYFVAGKMVRVTIRGIVSLTASPTITQKVKLGSVVLGSIGMVPGNPVNRGWTLTMDLVCLSTGASGQFQASGVVLRVIGTALIPGDLVNTSSLTIDTTASQTLDSTVQFSAAAAGNSITMQSISVEVLN